MKGKIVIDKQLCKGCKYCVMSCPKGVIVIEKQFNKMGYFTAQPEHMGKCTGCALCAQMCPELAIEVWAENNPDKSGLAEESRKKKA
jgi:2-oxoglutarate ferredoxin oxidoreductase subunit delta